MCQVQAQAQQNTPDFPLNNYLASHRHSDMNRIRIVMSLIQASHTVLDTLLYMDTATYLKCPTVTTIRPLYAMQEISMLGKSIQNSENMSSIITDESLAVRLYATQIKEFFTRAVGSSMFQVPRMALASLRYIPQPTTFGDQTQQLQQEQAQASHETIPNDIDSILRVDFEVLPESSHNALQCVSQGMDARAAYANAAPDASTYTLDSDYYTSTLPDMEMMVMPDVVLHSNWL